MPPLQPLHSDATLSKPKLDKFRKWTDRQIIDSLQPGKPESLRVRPDGTIINGDHRIKVLRERGVDVNALPREVIAREEPGY